MAFKQVLPGIFEIFLPLPMKPTIINVYLVDCGGGEWAMIDTGMNLPESFIVMEDAFMQVGARFEDLKVLIGTHHHIDHFGASTEIRRRSHAKTYLHKFEAERANRMLFFGKMGPMSERPESRPFFESHESGLYSSQPTPSVDQCVRSCSSRTQTLRSFRLATGALMFAGIAGSANE